MSSALTALLACLLLPVLKQSAQQQHDIDPVLTVVSSGVHAYARFKERNVKTSSDDNNDKPMRIFDVLDDPNLSDMRDRYCTQSVSKLLQLFVCHTRDRGASCCCCCCWY